MVPNERLEVRIPARGLMLRDQCKEGHRYGLVIGARIARAFSYPFERSTVGGQSVWECVTTQELEAHAHVVRVMKVSTVDFSA